MDDQKTQTDQQQGPLIETTHDGAKVQEQADDGLLHLSIRAPEKTVFEGVIESMTSKNVKGTFDILPYHENFISLIIDKVTIREKDKPPKDIAVGNAILKISKNRVEIYIGMEATLGEEGSKAAVPPTTASPDQQPPKAAST